MASRGHGAKTDPTPQRSKGSLSPSPGATRLRPGHGKTTRPSRPTLNIWPVPNRGAAKREDRQREICQPPSPFVDDLRTADLESAGDLLRSDEQVDVHHPAHTRAK